MKTIRLFTIAAIVTISSLGFAVAKGNDVRVAKATNGVELYIDLLCAGDMESVDYLFDQQLTYEVSNNGKVTKYSRQQLIDHMKQGKGIQQDCRTNYAIVESCGDYALAKVEMKYDSFSRVDYVTLNRYGNEWKVSQVTSTYPD